MIRKLFTPLMAASALALAAAPAYAGGNEDRAREAIAAAEAKIHTAESLGAATQMPEETAKARAALAMAREHFAADDNGESVEAAVEASAIADATIGQLQQDKQEALANQRASADVANQQAANAQEQAANANARAAMAEQSAAASAAEARSARDALVAEQAADQADADAKSK